MTTMVTMMTMVVMMRRTVRVITSSNIPLHTHHFAEDALNAILVNLKAMFLSVVKRIESNRIFTPDS